MLKNKASVAGWSVLLLCLGAGFFVVSCDKFSKPTTPLAATVTFPGADYVGMAVCETCHDKMADEFRGTPHSKFTVIAKAETEGTKDAIGDGCESCHGPGSLHVAGRGDKTKIVKGDWRMCVSCHLEKKSAFMSRYHHPVPEGRMSCTACHDPHKGTSPVNKRLEQNEMCFKCHPDKKGPWVFPHDAIKQDGCVACHDPHGTNQDKMLIADQNNLCLRCHYNVHTYPSIGGTGGGFGHANRIYRGGPGGVCINCHMAIHGSNFKSTLFQ